MGCSPGLTRASTAFFAIDTKTSKTLLTPDGHPLTCVSVAQMAELVDAPASGAGTRKGVEVRVLFWAPFHFFNRFHPIRICSNPYFEPIDIPGKIGNLYIRLFNPFHQMDCNHYQAMAPNTTLASSAKFRAAPQVHIALARIGEKNYRLTDSFGLYLPVEPRARSVDAMITSATRSGNRPQANI